MAKPLDILDKKRADLSVLVESLEKAGYMVQARRIRGEMTQSVRKQNTGGQWSTGHLNVPPCSNIPAENVGPDKVGAQEFTPPSMPNTSKRSNQTASPVVQLRPLELNQCVGKAPNRDPSFVVKMDDPMGSRERKLHEGGQVKLQSLIEVKKLEELIFSADFYCPDKGALRTFFRKNKT